MKKLSKDEMKMVVGGTQRYACNCNDGSASWDYPNAGNTPPQQVVSNDVHEGCESGGASCGWVTCGNPGAPC